MNFLDKSELSEALELAYNAQIDALLEEVSKGMFKEPKQVSEGFRIFNWKTETYLNDSIYESKEAASAAINELDNASDFLVSESNTDDQ